MNFSTPNFTPKLPPAQPAHNVRKGRAIVSRIVDLIWFLFTWFLLVGVVCAALLGVHFYGRVDEQIRTHVEQLLADQYPGLEVSVRYAKLVEREGFRIGGVSFVERNPDGATRDLAFVDEVLVRCKPTLDDLLRGHVEVTEVIVRHPAVRSIKNGDGSWSIKHFAKIPKFGGHSLPIVFVDDATLEIHDPFRRPSALMTLRDIRLQVQPELTSAEGESAQRVRLNVEGSFSGDHLQRTTIQAAVDPQRDLWRLVGQVAGLNLSPALAASVPSEVADQLDQFGDLQAHCAFSFDVTNYDAYAGSAAKPVSGKLRYEINGSLVDGRLTEKALSLPLTDLSATFACNHESLRVENVRARFGEAVVHMTCQREGMAFESPIVLEGKVDRMRLDRSLVANLPPDWQVAWDKFRPVGQASAEFRLRRDHGSWTNDLTIQCHDVGFTWERFPYRVESTQGAVRIHGNQLSFDLLSRNARQPLQLGGEIENPGPNWTGRFHARAESPMALDEQVISATSEKCQRVTRKFAPQGQMTFDMRVSRSDPNVKPDHHIDVDVLGCRVRHEAFPYPLHQVSGRIERRNENWNFRDLRGANDSARITCEGHYEGGNTGLLTLRFVGTNVPLEEELRVALPSGSQSAWLSLQPQGTMDHVAADFQYRPATGEKHVVVTMEERSPDESNRAESLSIRPERFPYRVDQLSGVMRYEDGKVEFRKVHGRHGDTEIAASGSASIGAADSWELAFDNLTVDRLSTDVELLEALPAALKQMLRDVHLDGTVWLDGALRLGGAVNVPDSLAAAWRVKVDFEDAAMWLGTPLDHVFGQVSLEGNSRAGSFGCRGTLDIDSLMAKGIQLTSVRGPIWMDPNRFLAGSWAGQSPDGVSLPPIESQVFGGRLQSNFQALRNDDGRFDLQFQLSDAQLKQIERLKAVRHKVAPRGRVWANVQLTGNKHGRHNLRGAGSAQIRDANFYELPFFLSLLKSMRTGSTDRTAFTASDARFRLQGDHIYFDNLDLVGDTLTMKGVGEMNMNRDVKLDFYSVVGREEAYLPAVRSLLGMASRRFLLVKVEGNVENPIMTREVLPGLNDTLRQLFPEVDPTPPAPVVKIDSTVPLDDAVQRASAILP